MTLVRDGAVAVEALNPSDVDSGVAAHYGDPSGPPVWPGV